MFKTSTFPQACLGYNNSQVSGHDPRQGHGGCEEERVLCWADLCGLLTCMTSERLAVCATFPFQRVANLANSQCHKERLQEDKRLRRLSERSLSKNLFLSKHKVHVKESSESFKLRQRVRNKIFLLLRLEITTAALNLLLWSILKMLTEDLLSHPNFPQVKPKWMVMTVSYS